MSAVQTVREAIPTTIEGKEGKETAAVTFSPGQVLTIALVVVIAVVGLTFWPVRFLRLLVVGVTSFYFAVLIFKRILEVYALTHFRFGPDEDETMPELEGEPPTITVLAPLYKEGYDTVFNLTRSLMRLAYPKDKLQILIIVREEDELTLSALAAVQLEEHVHVVKMGPHYPQTKPSALNWALRVAMGDYCVIFDAEDAPHPLQPMKAMAVFEGADPNVVAVHGRTECWNAETSFISRNFTVEYATYYRLVIPALTGLNLPTPLPGNSVYFKTSALKQLGGWDPYNMTEDCEIGQRIARKGWRVQTMNSVTTEEAPIEYGQWLKQRTRWLMGFMQTYLVHMRSPLKLLGDLGLRNFLAFQVAVGAVPFVLLVNPFLWFLTIAYVVTGSVFIEQLHPGIVLYMGVANMILGLFTYIYGTMIGCMHREMYGSVKWMLLSPLYWLPMSVAALRAVVRLIFAAHVWEKTDHGLVSQKDERSSVALVREASMSD